MFYKNARIFCKDFSFHIGAFEVVDGKFGEILPDFVPEDVYLFLEFDSAERYLPMADTMIIYRWNRVYPADVIFSKDYLDCPWTLKETFEFSGHSHSKLTREVYVR